MFYTVIFIFLTFIFTVLVALVFDLFLDNNLSLHFGEVKTKSILFASKFKNKNVKKLNVKYGDIQIKQHSKVEYLGCD